MINKKKQKGFTLIEMMIVVVIIGILSTIVLVAVSRAMKSARDKKRVSDLENAKLTLTMYYSKNLAYPADWSDLVPAYMSEIPKDPQSPTYDYVYTPTSGDLTSGYQNCEIDYYSETLDKLASDDPNDEYDPITCK